MPNSNRYKIALTAAMGIFPVALDLTIVNVAIIPISKALHTDLNTIQWISIGYILASAALTALGGYMGSRFGNKRVFLSGLVVFGFFSLLCGLAPNIETLIVFRVLQGIGGGVLLPLGQSIALEPFTKEERAKAAALAFSPVLLAPVLGPIVGGLIIDNLNWQAIFLVNLPICLAAFYTAWKVLPKDALAPANRQTRFDYLGLVLSTLGVVVVVYAFKLVSQTDPGSKTALNPAGNMNGWGYWLVWVLLGLGGLLLGVFAIYSLKFQADPVLDLRLFKRYEFTISNLINWVASTASFGVLFLIPNFLQAVRLPNLSAFDTGLALVPMGLASLAGMILGGRLYSKVGSRPLVMAGAAFFAVGFWQLSSLTPTTSGGDLWPRLVLVGLSVTLTALPVQTQAVESLHGASLNKASSLVQSSKSIFGAVGPAVLVTVFVQQTSYHADQLRAELVQKGSPTGLTEAARQHLVSQAQTSAMNDVFTILIFGALALLVIALALPRRKAAPVSEVSETAEPDVLAR